MWETRREQSGIYVDGTTCESWERARVEIQDGDVELFDIPAGIRKTGGGGQVRVRQAYTEVTAFDRSDPQPRRSTSPGRCWTSPAGWRSSAGCSGGCCCACWPPGPSSASASYAGSRARGRWSTSPPPSPTSSSSCSSSGLSRCRVSNALLRKKKLDCLLPLW